jgi:isoleucyl-tRNA synthetase
MLYNEFKNPSLPEIGNEILAFWKENRVFEKSTENRKDSPTFTFFEGPPSANGTPGIHHVMARTIKDVFCRYKTLQGFRVDRKGGWDTHGLPIELQVEKELGITKEDIGKKITVEEYNRKCRETVMRFKTEWDELTERIGYWVDLNDPYITFDSKYIETLWYLLKKLYDKGLLYKGYTIQPYSPAAGTGLSSHELNQPGTYKMVKDTSITAQFLLKTQQNHPLYRSICASDEATYILAWTTTPWTLPANTALAIGANITYVLVDTLNPYTLERVRVVLAQDRVKAYFNPKGENLDPGSHNPGEKIMPWRVLAQFKGSEMAGLSYHQLFPIIAPQGKAFEVVVGDFVTTEDGTGIVHTSPTFGADDYRVARENDIVPLLVKDDEGKEGPVVDRRGKFVDEIGAWIAAKVKEHGIVTHKDLGFDDFYVKNYTSEDESHPDYKSTDVILSIILKTEGKAFKVEKYEHTYPHCWRTDKPILYYPLSSWFIKTTAYKDKLVDLNKTINWKPESTGTGRFGNWLENLVDWNLSRSRFWGTPLPIWRTEDGSEELCIGSMDELRAEAKKAKEAGLVHAELPEELDLHRPYVDDIVLLSASGKPMYREPDLIDVWFDSGAMPYAQWHYPFEKEEVFKANYPADFIAEGVDQTRGWFFTLHAIAVMLFDSVAFKNVIANGLVLDKDGNKMSKRLGNAIDPFKTLESYGPDATRWYMLSNANPWDNLKFNLDGVQEVQRRFFSTLTNTYAFFALYANLDVFRFDESRQVPVAERSELDRWILSKLQSLILEVETAMDDYDATRATRAIANFTSDQLSNWYVRLARKRFWRGEMTLDKQAAYETLFQCLETLSRLISSFAPFYAEWLYRNLHPDAGKGELLSVHLTDWPQADNEMIDTRLESQMQLAQNISSLAHSLRKKEKIKVRQPLQRILIPILNKETEENIRHVEELIKAEVNIKQIEYMDDDSGVVVKSVKPNLPKLGKQFGPKMKAISNLINSWTTEDIREIEQKGEKTIQVEGDSLLLTLEDVLISSQDIPGWSVASEEGITVALDVSMSDDLKMEGIARDIVNRVQNIRKDMGLEVQDKINIAIENGDEWIEKSVNAYAAYISTETQAVSLELQALLADALELELDEFTLKLRVTKA